MTITASDMKIAIVYTNTALDLTMVDILPTSDAATAWLIDHARNFSEETIETRQDAIDAYAKDGIIVRISYVQSEVLS